MTYRIRAYRSPFLAVVVYKATRTFFGAWLWSKMYCWNHPFAAVYVQRGS